MINIDNYPFVFPPYGHQEEYLRKHALDEYHACFWEMGSGKSKANIDNAALLFDAGKIEVVLIIALNGVHTNWPNREIPAHMPKHINHKCFSWDSKQSANKAWNYEKERILNHAPAVLRIAAVNVESLSRKGKALDFCKDLIKSCNQKIMIIVDESSTIKNPKSTRSKHVMLLGKYASYRRVLTGTPITQAPFDVWSQCEFLEPGLSGCTSYHAFTHRYAKFRTAMFGQRSFEVVDKFVNLDALNKKLLEFSSFVKKSECLDLPPKIYSQRVVNLSKDQKRAYEDMKDMMSVEINSEQIDVVNALSKLTKLQQIVCGHIIDEDGVVQRIDNRRTEEMMNVIHESTGKVIIWAHYRAALADIREAIVSEYGAESIVEYHGGIETQAREVAIDSFQDPDSPVRFFIANQSSAGYGLTLTQATTEIYYSNSFSLELRLQSEDRAHRPGQTKSVNIVDLVTPDTTDVKVLAALLAKVDVSAQVTGLLGDWLK
jgi:Mesyanzhinovviridae DNA helicase